MNVYRKSLFIQFLLFIVFIIMGANLIIMHYLRDSMPWLSFIFFGLLVFFGIFGFIYYRKKDQRICVITPKEMNTIKTLLYVYFGIYLLNMILSGMTWINQEVLAILSGIALMGVASYGTFMQYKILKIK